MGWFDRKKETASGERAQIEELRSALAGVQKMLVRVNESVLEGSKAMYLDASDYTNREAVVNSLNDKFHSTSSQGGNEIVARCIKTRAAFVWAGGVDARPINGSNDGKIIPEVKLLSRMIEKNGLNGAFGQQLGIEEEIEGQILLTLEWVTDADEELGGWVQIKHIPWTSTKYAVTFKDGSPSQGMESATWKDADGKDHTVKAGTSVFFRFNARIHDKEGWPILGGVLDLTEKVTRALKQWDAINWLFAHPTPFIKSADLQEAKEIAAWLRSEEINWRIGKMLIIPAELSILKAEGSWQSIKEALQTFLKIISANSGVPIQFLGFPEFMSNRATAENTMEPVSVVALSDQRTWTAGLTELFDKAVALYNDKAKQGAVTMKKGKARPEMTFVTSQHLDLLKELYWPMYQGGALTLDTLLGFLPGVIASTEAKQLKEEKTAKDAARQEAAAALAERLAKANAEDAANNADNADAGTTEGDNAAA